LNSKEIISSGLLELYTSGIASEAEKKQVEAWINQFPEVATELKNIELSLECYAIANAILPHSDVKQKLLLKMDAGATASVKTIAAKPVSLNFWKWVAAASVVLLIGSTILSFTLYNKFKTAQNKLKATEEQLTAATQQSENLRQDIGVVQNKYSLPVALKGMPQMPDAVAKIFWLTNTGEVMIDASNLPDVPIGMQYQFWAIVDGQPIDGGLIITNDKGKKIHLQKMKTFGKAEAFAISLEKEGGNPIPTKVVSLGKTI
jgi:anti-sigma-K factor RskA